jgi:hypothetical protein
MAVGVETAVPTAKVCCIALPHFGRVTVFTGVDETGSATTDEAKKKSGGRNLTTIIMAVPLAW